MKVMKITDKRKKIAAQAEELKELKLRFTERNEKIAAQAAEIEKLKGDVKAALDLVASKK
jgi:cell division protein FtsB